MSIITKVKNMSVHKPEERAQIGTANDRGYDLYKIISGIQMTLSLIVLSAILGFVINMSETMTNERIIVGQYGIEIKYLKTNVASNTNRISRVEAGLGEQRVKDATYKNPFRITGP